MKVYLGIDPGSDSGAIAAVDEEGNGLFAEDCYGTPAETFTELRAILWTKLGDRTHGIAYAAVEKVHTMPKQGISSAGKLMENFGFWQGFLLARYVPYELVTPQSWIKAVLAPAGCSKDGSLEYCRRKYPDLELGRKKDHGKSDALCIAEWARMRSQGVR